MSAPSSIPPPFAFGFDPGKFPSWRPGQDSAVLRVIDSKARISAECQPTGSGKSLLGMAVAKLNGARTVILTRRKALQDQLVRDFPIHDVRGQSSYPCVYSPQVNVDLGPCHAGMFCRYREFGCLYYDAVKVARDLSTQATVTNYAFWFQQAKRGNGQGLGHVDFLVCDEAHGIMDELSNFLTVEIARWEVERLGLKWPGSGDLETWKAWARAEGIRRIEKELAAAKGDTSGIEEEKDVHSPGRVRERRRLESLLERVKDLAAAEGRWAVELSDRGGTLKACPVWPGPYLERYLWQGVPKILLMSATLRPKALELLGLEQGKHFEFSEVQSSFPVDRRLVWCIEAPRMNHRLDDGEKGIWLDRIDQVLGKRLDRKVIVHVGSYERRNMLMTQSRYRNWMLGHARDDVDEIIGRFKRAAPPAILVSQSLTEGFDFPYEECEVQIIGKIPYPDTRDALVKARQEDDKDYGSYVAMQQVVQAAGRGMRAADDFCETVIVDGNSRWFMPRNGRFAPAWFNQAVRQVHGAIPEPGARVGEMRTGRMNMNVNMRVGG